MSHRIKVRAGKHVVIYDCPTCAAELEAPLEEAGQAFPCPTCSRTCTTPGQAELEQLRKQKDAEAREAMKQDAARREGEQQRAAREAAEAAERARADAERRAAKEAAAAAKPPRGVSVVAFGVVMCVSALAVYLLVVRPLQARLWQAEKRLEAAEARTDSLIKTVNQNAAAANATAERLVALAKVVDQNAVAADATAARLTAVARIVDSNGDELRSVGSLARNANMHAHSHSRF